MQGKHIVEVIFPPTVGYQPNKVYSYVTDLDVDGALNAIVRDPRGDMVLTKVVGIKPYTPKSFAMKHVVKFLYKQDVMDQLAKPNG